MQCYFCRCISQVQLDGNFPRMGGFFPARRESLLENVTYVKTKMFEETWLFDNLLLTHSWVSNRELCGFLLPCWCWGAEGLSSSAGSMCGLRALGSSGLLGSQIRGLERRSFGCPGFSVRWLTGISLGETLKGIFCVGSHWGLQGLLKSLRVRKQAENPPELGAINCSVSFRGKKKPNQTVFSSLLFFLSSTMSLILDFYKFLFVLIQNTALTKYQNFP